MDRTSEPDDARETPPQTGQASDNDKATFRQLVVVADFRVILASFALFCIASAITSVSVSVLVYERSQSALLSGVVLAANSLPYVIGASFLLAYADRLPARRGLVGVSLVQATVIILLATGSLPTAGVVAAVLFSGLISPIGTAIRAAVIPDLLDGGRYVLGRAVLNMTSYVMQAVGFAIAGVLIAISDAQSALWIAAALSVVVVALQRLGLRYRPPRAAGRGSAVAATWRINRQLMSIPAVRGVILAHWLPMAMVVGAEGVYVPYAAAHGNPSYASMLFWASAIANLTGDLAVGRFAATRLQERLSFPLVFLMAIPLMMFALDPGPVAGTVLCFIAALGVAYLLGLQRRFLQAVPEANRGQAFGLVFTGMSTLQGVTMVLGGALADIWAPSTVIACFGVGTVVCALALARYLRPEEPRHSPSTAIERELPS